MHGDIFRRVITGYTARCLLPGQTSSSMHATSNANVRSNGNIALTFTLFRWVSGEMPVLQNAASGFF